MDVESEPTASTTLKPQTLVANSAVMLVTRVFTVVASGVLSIFTVRLLSVPEYAELTIAMTLVVLVVGVAEFGISTLATREITLRPDKQAEIATTAVSAQAGTALVAAIVLVPLGLALGYSPTIISLLAIGAVAVVAAGALGAATAVFQARRVFWLSAVAHSVQAAVAAGLGLLALAAGLGPRGLMTAFALAYVAAVVCALVLIRRRLGFSPLALRPAPVVWSFIRRAGAIAATASLIAVYARIDVLLLSKLDNAHGVAIYNVPLLLVEMTFLIPAAIAPSAFPLITQQLTQAPRDAFAAVHLLWRLFFLGSVPIALVLGFGGTDLIVWVFGDRYRESGDVLAILAACVPVGFVNYLTWYVLLAAHREAGRLRALLGGLALNVALNVALIPVWGPKGSAVALLASDVAMVAWLSRIVNREIVAVPFLRLLGRPLAALVPAAAVGLALHDVSGFGSGVAAGVVYVAALMLGGYVSREEWEPLTVPLRALARRRSLRR